MEIVRQSMSFASLKVGDVFIMPGCEPGEPHLKLHIGGDHNAFNLKQNGLREVSDTEVVVFCDAKLVIKAWRSEEEKKT